MLLKPGRLAGTSPSWTFGSTLDNFLNNASDTSFVFGDGGSGGI